MENEKREMSGKELFEKRSQIGDIIIEDMQQHYSFRSDRNLCRVFLSLMFNVPTTLLAIGAKAEAEMRHKAKTKIVRNMVES